MALELLEVISKVIYEALVILDLVRMRLDLKFSNLGHNLDVFLCFFVSPADWIAYAILQYGQLLTTLCFVHCIS